MAIILLSTLSSCEHNVYIDEDIDSPKIWEVNGVFFSTANEAIEYVISNAGARALSDVEDSRVIKLVRPGRK